MSPLSRSACTLLLAVAMLAPGAARADQYVFLDMTQARAALAKLRAGDVVHTFCAPCGETRSERMTIRSLGIARVWDRDEPSKPYRDRDATYWMVEVNDLGIDLAYVYVREGRQWRNLAELLDMRPRSVPGVLAAGQVGSRWTCGVRFANPYWPLDARRDPCTRLIAEAARPPSLEWD